MKTEFSIADGIYAIGGGLQPQTSRRWQRFGGTYSSMSVT
jgi:hypothetical protein